ncbi:hypothetical protein pEaSNUABM44_00556 [Erwinia phage pEa_SNUABM_44]|nr:hypothetical protein pEaSNUABM44_00556 [Erwinia phage pEa_SNUABM_44]
MFNISVKSNVELDEVIKDIGSYTFDREVITKEVFVSMVEKLNPTDYRRLYYNNVLEHFTANCGQIDDEIAQVLLSGNIDLNSVVGCTKLSPEMIVDILTNHLDELSPSVMIEAQHISTEQLDLLLNSEDHELDVYSLGEAIATSGNVELAKHVVMNWDKFDNLDDIDGFRTELFNGFGSVMIDHDDELIIFGLNRPSMCAEELREHEPCSEGWKRVLKWTPRNGQSYTWNSFIAFHLLANQDDLDNAKSDLTWLAEVVADDNSYFY